MVAEVGNVKVTHNLEVRAMRASSKRLAQELRAKLEISYHVVESS